MEYICGRTWASQVKWDQIRSKKGRSGEMRSGQVKQSRSGEMRSGQVKAWQVRSKHGQSGETRSGQTKAGQVDHRYLLKALSDINHLWWDQRFKISEVEGLGWAEGDSWMDRLAVETDVREVQKQSPFRRRLAWASAREIHADDLKPDGHFWVLERVNPGFFSLPEAGAHWKRVVPHPPFR